MTIKVLLITPPFTQLNTPYPATACLKGFLEKHEVQANHCDLGIELFNSIFTRDFITRMFLEAEENNCTEFPLVLDQKNEYISKVERVIRFLQHHEVTEAYQILHPDFLPIAHRSQYLEEDLEWAFGTLGVIDKAKHLATLFIEELGDFIQANVDEFFSFNRYAEQIALTASSFDEIDEFLSGETTIIEDLLLKLLNVKLEQFQPDLVGFTIPFPGNLYAALRCAGYIKKHTPAVKIVFGGGFCNTELLSLTDPRIFNYVDFITLDDGEGPLLKITQFLSDKIQKEELERTYLLKNGKVVYQNKLPNTVILNKDLPTPNYLELPHDSYLSFLDVMNPMHRLWSDGKWNKLTISHGCYWKQCAFCDTSLDYISNYQPATTDDLVNKIEQIIIQTGVYGFHFTDEAAPPKILKALAEKLIERRIAITWWTNIRFEKTFTPSLCALLAKSGCIAVTGGLEVASDRLLKKMNKGVDIRQVAQVTSSFANQNVMVHAYLMYGFPTQTAQETIDSLEVVRQLFENRCISSAFWHLFTTTVHSPVGKDPGSFGIKITGPEFKGFAQNELFHSDTKGTQHEKFTKGLNLALNNYLNGVGFDIDLKEWFDFEVVPTTHPSDLIWSYLK